MPVHAVWAGRVNGAVVLPVLRLDFPFDGAHDNSFNHSKLLREEVLYGKTENQ